MSRIEDQLKEEFARAAAAALELPVTAGDIELSLSRDKAHGDYATNCAMKLAKRAGLKPREAAEKIAAVFAADSVNAEKLEIAGPGFLNVFMKHDSLQSVIPAVLAAGSQWGCSDSGHGERIMVEFVSANPTGDLHPGHARGAAIGDSLCRMMKKAGYDVLPEYYINDAGNQINNMAKSLQARYLQACGIDAEVPEDGYHGADLIQIAARMKEEEGTKYADMPKEESLPAFRAYGLQAEIAKLKADLDEFRVHFDVWTSEQSLYDRGLVRDALDVLRGMGRIYEADSALWLLTADFGDDKDRVLIKSDGANTYFTSDIAYHLDKYNRGYTKLIDLWGADHHGYIARVQAALTALGLPENTLEVEIIQMARLIKDGQEFKMSKRSGRSVALRDLMDEAGVDAVRYFFASRAADTQMDFDLDMATKRSNENPVYYAQYAHARMCSVLEKAGETTGCDKYDLINTEKELTLLKLMNEFPQVIADAAASRMPHKMVNYIARFAQAFHSYYNESKIVDPGNPEQSAQRVALVQACEITLKNALDCIGVSAPEHM